MINKFKIDDDFLISEANINIYTEPFIHPVRIMNEYDIIYLIQGKWQIGQNNESFTIKEDDILILAANEKHYGISPCLKGTKTMYFHFSMQKKEDSQENFITIPSLIDVSFNPKIKDIFYEIVKSKHLGKIKKAEMYCKLLLIELEDNSQVYKENNIASIIESIIHRYPEKFFTNNDIAKKVGASVKTCETMFKKYYGTTIHQYILKYKIDEAILFFKNFPNMSIKEVSANLGFFDEYHFSKQFKKIMNISPREYKKKFKSSSKMEDIKPTI